MTLKPLANFYGLDLAFLEQLVSWGDLDGSALRTVLRERTFELMSEAEAAELTDAPDELRLLALRVARAAGSSVRAGLSTPDLAPSLGQSMQTAVRAVPPNDYDDLTELLDRFGQLDRRRRKVLLALVADLQAGRDRELGI